MVWTESVVHDAQTQNMPEGRIRSICHYVNVLFLESWLEMQTTTSQNCVQGDASSPVGENAPCVPVAWSLLVQSFEFALFFCMLDNCSIDVASPNLCWVLDY